jgi:hypothetical protein
MMNFIALLDVGATFTGAIGEAIPERSRHKESPNELKIQVHLSSR